MTKDFLGNELKVGDTVVYLSNVGNYASFKIGIITEVNSNNVIINDYIHRALHKVIKMPETYNNPIVYCENCKHHMDTGYHWCRKLGIACQDDYEFFCKFGEKG